MSEELNFRDIRRAHKKLQLAWEHLSQNWPKKYPDNPVPFLSQVYRSPQMQDAYYAQGRKPLVEVNALRKKAGLGPIAIFENRHKVTNAKAGQSRHERTPSEAFDIAFVKKGTKSELDGTPKLFLQAAQMIREFDPSLTWGGDWNKNWKSSDERMVDYPHFQV